MLIEESMKKIHSEDYDNWVNNFALNLEYIWTESSAKGLTPNAEKLTGNQKSPAIVIGRGPSLKKFHHLELLRESNYNGTIICCDGALIDTLKAGVTPDKFPNFLVVTIDPDLERIKKYYDHELVKKHGSKIKGVFSVLSHPLVVEQARQSGIKIHWVHSLFDYNEGKKSFNYISSLIVRSKNHPKGLPAIQTGGNVGTSSWFIAWMVLKCSPIALVGINLGWEEDDSWDTIIRHGVKDLSINIDKNSSSFQKLFPKVFNPDIGKYCILDPIFQFYSAGLKEFISRSPSWLTTINATEGGSVFGNRIKSMTFSEFLRKH